MPLPKGTRFRMKDGVRLAFGNGVIEAKNMKTGATHTKAEFTADKARARENKARRKALE